jgi:hypothetical protein
MQWSVDGREIHLISNMYGGLHRCYYGGALAMNVISNLQGILYPSNIIGKHFNGEDANATKDNIENKAS